METIVVINNVGWMIGFTFMLAYAVALVYAAHMHKRRRPLYILQFLLLNYFIALGLDVTDGTVDSKLVVIFRVVFGLHFMILFFTKVGEIYKSSGE